MLAVRGGGGFRGVAEGRATLWSTTGSCDGLSAVFVTNVSNKTRQCLSCLTTLQRFDGMDRRRLRRWREMSVTDCLGLASSVSPSSSLYPAFPMSFSGLPLAVLDAADETSVETRCRAPLLMLQMYACTS